MAEKERLTITVSEILYYVFFGLLLFAKGIGLYDGQAAFKVLLVVAVAAWLGKMLLTEYTKKELLRVIFLLGLGVLIYLVSGEKGALLYILMVTGLKNVPVKRIFAVGATVWSIAFIGLTWLNALHILDGPFKVHEKLGMGMIIRWGLGYAHPNVLHISYLIFVMFIVYLLDRKFDWKSALILMIGNMIIYVYSISSTGVISVTFYLALNLYWQYRRKLNRIEKILIQLVMPFCVLFSLLAPFLLKGQAFDVVNDIMNTRLNLAKHFLSLYSPTLFGIRLSEITTSQLTMDNSYVFAFVTYGLIMFIVIVGAYLALIRKHCREQKGMELCIILASLVAGIMEPFLFNTAFKNLSLLFTKELLFKEGEAGVIRFPLCSDKKLVFSIKRIEEKIRSFPEKINLNRKIIILITFAGFVLGSIGYQCLKQEPTQIIVPRSACDIGVLQRTEDTLKKVYLTAEDIVGMRESKVYGYVDEQTEMIIYSDGIVKMEHLRGILCSGITIGILFGILATVYSVINSDKSESAKKRRKL